MRAVCAQYSYTHKTVELAEDIAKNEDWQLHVPVTFRENGMFCNSRKGIQTCT